MSLLIATLPPPPYPRTNNVNKYFFCTVITNSHNIVGVHWSRPMTNTITIRNITVEQPIVDCLNAGNATDAVKIKIYLQTTRRISPETLWTKYPQENGIKVYNDFPFWW